jgi:hypothetical protein
MKCYYIFLFILLIIMLLIIISTKFTSKKPFENVWNQIEKQELKKLLAKLSSLCKNNDIPLILSCGSLLGYTRENKKAIQWDDDVDMLIPEKDREKFEKMMENDKELSMYKYYKDLYKIYLKNSPNTIEIKNSLFDKLVSGTVKWKWPFIDIFFYNSELKNDEEKPYYLITPTSTFFGSKIVSNIKPYKLPTNLQTFRDTFENIEVDVPVDYKLILETEYGKDWKEICVSSTYDHKKEKIIISKKVSKECKDVKM